MFTGTRMFINTYCTSGGITIRACVDIHIIHLGSVRLPYAGPPVHVFLLTHDRLICAGRGDDPAYDAAAAATTTAGAERAFPMGPDKAPPSPYNSHNNNNNNIVTIIIVIICAHCIGKGLRARVHWAYEYIPVIVRPGDRTAYRPAGRGHNRRQYSARTLQTTRRGHRRRREKIFRAPRPTDDDKNYTFKKKNFPKVYIGRKK